MRRSHLVCWHTRHRTSSKVLPQVAAMSSSSAFQGGKKLSMCTSYVFFSGQGFLSGSFETQHTLVLDMWAAARVQHRNKWFADALSPLLTYPRLPGRWCGEEVQAYYLKIWEHHFFCSSFFSPGMAQWTNWKRNEEQNKIFERIENETDNKTIYIILRSHSVLNISFSSRAYYRTHLYRAKAENNFRGKKQFKILLFHSDHSVSNGPFLSPKKVHGWRKVISFI